MTTILRPARSLGPSNAAVNIVKQDILVRQAARADIPAGKQPRTRGDHGEAVVCKGSDVILGDRVFKHMGVHRRCDEFGAGRGQRDRREHIVGQAVGSLAMTLAVAAQSA